MFWNDLLRILDTQMTTPPAYGWFHILFFAASIVGGILLCVFCKDCRRYTRPILLITSLTVILLEVYKLVNFSFGYADGTITADFPWYAFPWQFCSTPMYVGLLAGLTRGKVHRSLCAYLATFAVFAGLCVMIYPNDVFIGTVGVNIQTMICHGSMLTIGIYLLGSGYVPRAHKTILHALPVFCGAAAVAMVLNEIAYRSGLLETDSFNMFYFSPHQDPHLPIFSDVQRLIGADNPLCMVVYIAGFTLAAYLVLLIAMGIGRLLTRRQKAEVTV